MPIQLWSLNIYRAANQRGFDPYLLFGLVHIESDGEQYAWNPEPRYPWLWDVKAKRPFRRLPLVEATSPSPPDDFPCLRGDPHHEWWGQKASWGLCQVMGAVARELGYLGPYLPAILNPDLNLDLGSLHLRRLISRFGVEGGVSAYNHGSPIPNDPYAAKILMKAQQLKAADESAPKEA